MKRSLVGPMAEVAYQFGINFVRPALALAPQLAQNKAAPATPSVRP